MDIMNLILGVSAALAEGGAAAGEAATEMTAAENIIMLVTSMAPMLIIFVVFYFILIRPQRKKDKQVKEMLNSLKKDDRVCTIGGIYGTVVAIKDDTIELSVGRNNLSMVVARWAIRSVEEISIENDAETLN